MPVVNQIFDLFNRQGHQKVGEKVTQLTHALHTAHYARMDNAPAEEVVAALLHDIGHLWEADNKGDMAIGYVANHEELGDQFLRRHFAKSVTEPVRLHVAAKRYLCAVDLNFFAGLSQASVGSLRTQGGPMSKEEIALFRANPFCKSAVRLRRWNDIGQDEDLTPAKLESYRELVESCVLD